MEHLEWYIVFDTAVLVVAMRVGSHSFDVNLGC